jgi:hypothetical protein
MKYADSKITFSVTDRSDFSSQRITFSSSIGCDGKAHVLVELKQLGSDDQAAHSGKRSEESLYFDQMDSNQARLLIAYLNQAITEESKFTEVIKQEVDNQQNGN